MLNTYSLTSPDPYISLIQTQTNASNFQRHGKLFDTHLTAMVVKGNLFFCITKYNAKMRRGSPQHLGPRAAPSACPHPTHPWISSMACPSPSSSCLGTLPIPVWTKGSLVGNQLNAEDLVQDLAQIYLLTLALTFLPPHSFIEDFSFNL